MYQQFSLTIAFAVVLSVFNAVTFTQPFRRCSWNG